MAQSKEKVVSAIRNSWDGETSASPEVWTPATPALGQCVPSSLVAQDMFGGEIQRLATERDGVHETHYRNVLPDGSTLDISGDQYPRDQQFAPAPVEGGGVREYVLGNENTVRRYHLLLERAMALIQLDE